MSNYPDDQVCSPPELPPHLKSVYDLKPIVGVPGDTEVIEIHAVIRVANKVIDLQDMGDPTLLSQLSEHLFNVQMAKYRSKYPCSIFSSNVTYTPPALPVHVSANLEPITGAPSEEEVLKVQNAIRSYQKLTDLPSLFDPQVNAELSQHLFDIQMARYIQRCRQASPAPCDNIPVEPSNPVYPAEQTGEETNSATNNLGRGADVAESHQTAQSESDASIRDAIERSNQLSERSNQLIERSNQIVEQLTRVVEQSRQPAEQPNSLTETFAELFERLNEHLGKSNLLAEASTESVEKLGDVLGNTNRVLMKIQHAIIRSYKGNTLSALDCLANEKGEAPGVTERILKTTFRWSAGHFADKPECHFPVFINGAPQDAYIPDGWLGYFLNFYGIGDRYCDGANGIKLIQGKESAARKRLCNYLSSCLG